MIQKLPKRDEYFTDHSKVSRSALFKFRKSRWEYYLEYVAKTAPPRPSSQSMDLGTIVHTMVLEPEKTSDVCGVCPHADRRTKAAKEWLAQNDNGKIILKRDEHAQCVAMADSLRASFGNLLASPGPVEHPIEWLDEETGVECKCRPDKLVQVGGETWILDIKTAKDASPRGFQRSCEDYGYWLQDAHYRDGVRRALGGEPEFVFLVVQNSFPYTAAAYVLDAESRVKSESRRVELLSELQRLDPEDERQWRDDWMTTTNTIQIRDWAY